MKRAQFFYEGDTGGGSGGGASGAADGSTLLSGVAVGGATTGEAAQSTVATGSEFNWAKPDGSLSEGWLDKFEGDLKGNASLKSIGTIQDLAKSYVETKKLIGTKLSAPGEGATPEQIASWRKTVGAPEKPEGYYGDAKTLRPESVPEQYWDTNSEKQFLEIAHKHHLPPAAVKEILGYYGENIAKGVQASAEREGAVLAQEGTKLKELWGTNYDGNLALSKRMAQTLGLDPNTHPIFTTAEGVDIFAKMGRMLSEDKLVKGDSSGINGSIADRIRDIQDPKGTSQLSRAYRGELGEEQQLAAQQTYHQLLNAQGQK